MSGISDALAGLKTALGSLDPSPQPALENIYVWPDDYASMDYRTFPFAIVAQTVNRWNPIGDEAHGLVRHSWPAEINICLADGTLNFETASEIEAQQADWIIALATVLSANRGLGGSALAIGTDDQLFRYRIGHIGWEDSNMFWGIRAEVQVYQQHSLPAS